MIPNKGCLVWLSVAFLITLHSSECKYFTSEDAIIVEDDPQPAQVRPYPSLFHDLEPSPSSKVKRRESEVKDQTVTPSSPEAQNAQQPQHPRYYEMINDEIYVFEPSSLGMEPFREAMSSSLIEEEIPSQIPSPQTNINANNGYIAANPHENYIESKIESIQNQFENQHAIGSTPYSQFLHNQNSALSQSQQQLQLPHPRDFESTRPSSRPHSPSGQNSQANPPNMVPNFGQSVPILVPHMLTAQDHDISHNDALRAEYPHQSPRPEFNRESSDRIVPQKHRPGSVDLVGYGCVTANGKEGQCVPFRACYPIVFNMIDGKLRNPELAEILFQASGICTDESGASGFNVYGNGVNFNRYDLIGMDNLELKEEKNIIFATEFHNQTICCPGFLNPSPSYETANSYSQTFTGIQQQEQSLTPLVGHGKPLLTMKPSQPDPDFHPPVTPSSADYYEDDEYDIEQIVFTTTEISKITPKVFQKSKKAIDSKNGNATKGNSTSVSAHSKKESKGDVITKEKRGSGLLVLPKTLPIESEIIPTPESNATENITLPDSSNSSSKDENEEIIVIERTFEYETLEKVYEGEGKNVTETQENPPGGEVNNDPEVSAWKCPGREIAMPRGHWPWMAALLFDGNHMCTGALIDHHYVLTSASCVNLVQANDLNRLRVILGDRVLYSDVDGTHAYRMVHRITKHLLFSPLKMGHDIALIEMDVPVAYSGKVQPINLPVSLDRSHTSRAIVSGWSGPDIGVGKDFFEARSSSDAVLDFMEIKDCRKSFEGFLSDGVPTSVICTKPSNISCMADLGAPLMMKTDNCWHIVGILSQGLGCGTFPELYTNVANHLEWIQRNVRNHTNEQLTLAA